MLNIQSALCFISCSNVCKLDMCLSVNTFQIHLWFYTEWPSNHHLPQFLTNVTFSSKEQNSWAAVCWDPIDPSNCRQPHIAKPHSAPEAAVPLFLVISDSAQPKVEPVCACTFQEPHPHFHANLYNPSTRLLFYCFLWWFLPETSQV